MCLSSLIRPAIIAVLAVMAAQAHATPSLVVDADTGEVLHAEDAGLPWFPASVTKLMTAFVVFEQLQAGRIGMDTEVVLSREAVRQIPTRSELPAGSAMTMEDALYAALAGSANDVAYAVGETVGGSRAAFVKMMNETAGRLGMTSSHFANPNGVFDREQFLTARDLAVLALEIRRRFPQYMHFFQVGRIVIGKETILSNNDLLTRFPGTIGMKTGFLCASGRNFVALTERQGRTLLAVILGATTDRERSERAAQLLTRAFDGELRPTGTPVSAIANRADRKPVDMRQRLCSKATAAYEKQQEAAYPMGLGGHASYLGAPGEFLSHTVTSWPTATAPAKVPVPTPRPAYP
ncbi:MAG TPA: D-alanyl-D-alanine carboxypeptidase family protein [Rhizobiaceae bacterium]|nr:D-alanyl-D-alanine carboxypeptidase family protein [Rhizobiaceae bacterium]